MRYTGTGAVLLEITAMESVATHGEDAAQGFNTLQ
jgi:hypothetical protein